MFLGGKDNSPMLPAATGRGCHEGVDNPDLAMNEAENHIPCGSNAGLALASSYVKQGGLKRGAFDPDPVFRFLAR
jgi:hypothetical protein